MARVRIVAPESTGPIDTLRPEAGRMRSRIYFNQPSDPLHLTVHHLGANVAWRLENAASDLLAYVWAGAVIARGMQLGERSSLIVERCGSIDINALERGASILVFSPREQPPRQRSGSYVHLLPRERVPRSRDLMSQGTVGGALHADASSACCQLWLHENDFYVAGTPVPTHSHSEEEIIFVREGELCVGHRRYGAGAALAIAANVKYGFQVGAAGLSFVNFRAAAPTYTAADGATTFDEAQFWRSQTGLPEHVNLQSL